MFLCLGCFLQEKNTRRIFYGLDDIEKASEIIIVSVLLPPIEWPHGIDDGFNSLGEIFKT